MEVVTLEELVEVVTQRFSRGSDSQSVERGSDSES